MDRFRPLIRNPHLQTIVGHYWKRPDSTLRYPVERRLIRTEPDVQVLVCSQRPQGEVRGEIYLVHGLEGSGEAGYIRSLSAAALEAGFAAHRFHMRTCGGTESLCPTLYHAGLTSDLKAVVRDACDAGRAPAFLVGFSLGGNVVLKLAGEGGEEAKPYLRGVCSVSAPLDLGACARRIDEWQNRAYQVRFLRKMRTRMLATGRYQESEFAGIASITELDDRFTAPAFGFGDSEGYYRTQSAIGFLAGVRVPGLMIQAKDAPMVPFAIYESAEARANPRLELIATDYGGHLGFLGRSPNHLWCDQTIMQWIARQTANESPSPSSED
jgi:uncharacterized protein